MKTLHNYHQVWLQYGFTPEFYYIPQAEAGANRESYPLRPELIESIMYLCRATEDPFLLQAGEDILRSIQHSAKTPCGYATIKDVKDHRKEDRMESFFLSETTKYLYLLFDTDNFIHNQGQHGNVIETPNGQCVVESGGYIFNTEAHPIDPAALHCCYNIPSYSSFNFSDFEEKKSLYRGEIVGERRSYINKNKCENEGESTVLNKTEDVVVGEITTESSNSYVTLEDNDNISQKIYSEKLSEETEPLINENIDNNRNTKGDSRKKFDVQQMLERFRNDDSYKRNATWENNYKLLSCKAQPFLQRFSILGEFFKYI